MVCYASPLRYPLFIVTLVGALLVGCSAAAQPEETPVDLPRLRFTSAVRGIVEDSHGNVWFGSHAEGAARLTDGVITYYTVEDGLPDSQVRNIYEAGDGTVWFECGSGIAVYADGLLRTVSAREYPVTDHWNIANEQLWFKPDWPTGYTPAEGGSGVYGYDGRTLVYHRFPPPPEGAIYDPGALSAGFARGANGRTWFGTYNSVVGYDGREYTQLNNTTLLRDESTGYLHVRAIYEDTHGRLWIGNNGIGVLRYENGRTLDFSKEQGLTAPGGERRGGFRAPTPTLEHVFAIGEDHAGNIWFGDRDSGAWRYAGDSLENFGVNQGLPVPHIWQIYRSKGGELWFAMENGSVMAFADGRFRRKF